jgi:hypothetical protein
LAISKGIDRDRAVDESSNQLAVFGRRGARPLNHAEMRSLYIHSNTGQFYGVTDDAEEKKARAISPSAPETTLSSFFTRARAWLSSFNEAMP